MEGFRFLLQHEVAIYLISAVVSLLLGVVIFSLRGNTTILQERKWIGPFAWTFVVVAVAYGVRLIQGSLNDLKSYTTALLAICSGGTNFLLFLAAFRLVDLEPSFVKLPLLKQWLLGFQKRLTGGLTTRIMLFLILCAVALTRLIEGWDSRRLPGVIFSALALTVMGLVLYQNMSFRRDKVMAWFALASSICYAAQYIFLIVIQTVAEPHSGNIEQALKINELLVYSIALPLKFFLFFSGYFLMLRIAGPVEGLERLLDSATRKEREYLENDGIVRSIHDQLKAKNVRLYIRLPGSKENQLAFYSYPASTGRSNRVTQKLDYTEGTVYDQVMKSGEPDIRYENRDFYWFVPRVASVAVPIFFHNSVIACLEAETGDEKFTKADEDYLVRIATLISPAVQAYREVSALSKISEDLAQLQLKVVSYDMDVHINEIVEVVQNVVSPLGMAISIEAGFSKYSHTMKGDLATSSDCDHFDAPISEEFVVDYSEACLWLKRQLRILPVDSEGRIVGDQFIGKFVFAADKEAKRREHPTLSTNFLYHRAVSVLITDTLLDFIRGYLNQLTDKLGVALSGLEETKPAKWLERVDAIAKKAGLIWVVASYPDNDELLGGDQTGDLVNKLRENEHEKLWQRKDDGLWLYSLDQPEVRTHHIIKKEIKGTKLTLWFGVERPNFGLELDYTSPWKFFIDHFCEIASSALHRILLKNKEEEQRKWVAEFRGLATSALTTGTVVHQLLNYVQDLEHPLTALEFMPRQDGQRKFIMHIRRTGKQIENLTKLFAGVVKPDDRRPCALSDAVQEALKVVQDSLKRYNIEIACDIPQCTTLDVPFHVAVTALTNVVNNAKDAIRDGQIKDGRIHIDVKEGESMFVCQVTNNGPPVPLAVRRTLFKGLSKSDKPYSHGLGLYLSAHSLLENGGDIALTDSGPDNDTTFSISFPKVRSA